MNNLLLSFLGKKKTTLVISFFFIFIVNSVAQLSIFPSPTGYTGGGRGYYPSATSMDNILYTRYQDANFNYQLAKFNGALLDIIPNPVGYNGILNGYSGESVVVGSTLYAKYIGNNGNRDLAKYDGTTLTIIDSPTGFDADGKGLLDNNLVIGTTLYMRYQENNFNYHLAKYENNTLTIVPNPAGYSGHSKGYEGGQIVGNKLYMSYLGDDGNDDLAIYDGNTITLVPSPAGYENNFRGYNGVVASIGTDVYLSYTSNTGNTNLFKFDEATLTLTAIPNPVGHNGNAAGYSGSAVVMDNVIYMEYTGNDGNYDLAKYDGTTLTIIESPAGYENGAMGYTDSPLVIGSTLYIRYRGNDLNYVLAKYDGTTLSIIPSPSSHANGTKGYMGNPIAIGNNLYMQYKGNDNNYDLAKYDGTTLSIINSPSGYTGSERGYNGKPVVMNGKLYMQYIDNNGTGNYDLFKYDETTLTSIPSPSRYTGNNSGYYEDPYVLGSTLYMRYRGNDSNFDLGIYRDNPATIPFRTTWVTNNNRIIIPTFFGESYNYTVTWTNLTNAGVGDGSRTNRTGIYTINGLENGSTYEVAITGIFPRFHMESRNSERLKLRTIEEWGNQAWTSMGGAFYNCENLTYNATDIPNLSLVTNMLNMFKFCTLFNGNIGNWDTPNVVSMNNLFAYATTFNQNIGNWNMQNVINTDGMFDNATAFNQDISNWDTQNINSMSHMFRNATTFNQPIGNWNTRNVTRMDQMFSNATAFNQNLGNWDITNIVQTFGGNGMTEMLNNSGLNTANYDATLIGWAAQNINQGIVLGATGLTYCTAQAARNTLTSASNNWTITGDNFVCSTRPFRTTWVTDDGTITIPTNGTGYNYDITWTNLTNTGVGNGSATAQTGNYTITGLENNSTYEIAITGDFPRFYMNSNTTERTKIRTIEEWGDIVWSSMENAFLNCSQLTYNATDSPDLSSVTSMARMFKDCDVFDGNATMNNWNIEHVTDMSALFHNNLVFNQPLNNWNTQNVTNMYAVFLGTFIFNQPLDNWNTQNVTNMNAMFRGARLFNQDISSWNTQNVTDMSAMFLEAREFNQNISGWNTQNVKNMYGMFRNATNFNQTLGNWNISNVIVFLSDGMGTMLNNSGLNTANYDATLIGWAAQNVKPNINLGAAGLTYCAGQAARNTLTSAPNNWTITGDALICPTPEINLQGNGIDIASNDITPNINDNTDFGNVATSRLITYTIQNTGTGDLTISSIVISGANASEFVLNPLTFPLTIVVGNTANFDIIFTPTGSGTKTATITVNNTDSDEGTYNFAIKGISPTSVPNDFFVKTTGGDDTNGGTSFTDAYATLEKALSIANFGDKIYVAKGIYNPTRQVDVNMVAGADIHKVTFQIPDGVEVYGGFAGNEIEITQTVLDARNFITNTTILSGDLSGNDAVTGTFPNLVYENYTDNAYHIVYTKNVSSATKVDGFTVKGGNGISGTGWYNDGSGLGNSSNPTLKNIIFSQNNSIAVGGAMYNHGYQGVSSPHLTNCFFFQNKSSVGGAMHNNGSFIGSVSIPTLTNCSFSQNYASHSGSAIYNDGYSDGTSGVNLTNCSFSQNHGEYRKGAIFFAATEGNTFAQIINTIFDKNDVHIAYDGVDANQDIKFINCTFTGATEAAIEIDRWSSSNIPINFSNCIFWNNTAMKIGGGGTATLAVTYSIIENNTYTGIGNINQNPLFVNTTTGDLRLQDGSPALDMGSNAAINSTGVTIDLAGNARIQGTTVDMGAYEKAINLSEINLQGNGIDIANNDITPNINDNTDFGNILACNSNTIVKTFTIQNTGTAPLTVSNLIITGTNASDFALSGLPSFPFDIAANNSQTFTITFNSVTGTRTANIEITNNDADENPYIFSIKATGTADTQNPTITTPTNVTANTDIGICTASNITLGTPTGTDNCGTVTFSNNAPSVFPIGTTTVIWTADDGNGNTTTANQTVTVSDTQNPTITVPSNITANTDLGICTASNVTLGTPTGTDNCGTVTFTNNAPTNFPIGVTDVIWTANDGNGNTVTANQTVTISDAKEINLVGNGISIADGTTTTSTTDNTDFGNVGASRTITYTLENTGTENIDITSITSNNTDFVVSTIPTTVLAGSTSTFDVTFSAANLGLSSAIITINNTDCDESVYDFAVQATKINVTPPPPPAPIEANLKLNAVAVSSTQINLDWTLNTQATSYLLYRNERFVEQISSTTDTYFDENLTPDTFYQYKLIAVINSINSLPSADNEWTLPEQPILVSLGSVCGNGGKPNIKLTATGSIYRVYNQLTNGTLLLESFDDNFELPFTNQDTIFYVSVVGNSRKESERLPVNVEIQTPFESVILGENTQSSCTNSLLLEAKLVENADSYTWFRNGVQVNTGRELIASFSGNYQLRTTKGNCSYMSEEIKVLLNQSPKAQIEQNQTTIFCANGILNAIQTSQNDMLNATYQWKFNNSVVGNNPNLEISEEGIYLLIVSTATCIDSTSIEVIITEKPQIPILAVTKDSICKNNETTISVENIENGITYQWFRNGRNLYQNASSITTNQKGEYQVRAISIQNGSCNSVSNSIQISHFADFVVYLRKNQNRESIFVETANSQSQITNVEWYFEGELNPQLGNNIEITPTEKGYYSAKVTNQNGCIFQTRVAYFSPKIITGEQDLKVGTFKIYPNPSNGIFKVQFETALSENTEVTIFDGIGRKIHTQTFEKGNQEFVIDVKNQSKGMYLINFNQNDKVYSKQIIIE
ncbi:BspA family leucine-rich repeat surface protein [Bernardetia sp. Wsw4-3y2]|uniref:BspA family leucine-rich repeat surface protein n=1 Tax=Bernardetia sp. Wsw4-3y2 TaxID=3127471 RepID=UPI0030CCE121